MNREKTMYIGLAAVILIAAGLYVIYNNAVVLSGVPGFNSCTPTGNYLCQGPVYNHATGNITVSVTQTSGANWVKDVVEFVPAGTPVSQGVPVVSWAAPNGVNIGNLSSGQLKTVTLPVSGKVALGARVSGSVWIQYQITAGGTVYYAQVGTVSSTAT